MIDERQLRQVIIQPVLTAIGLYSREAEDLMVGTCAVESRGGTYVRQLVGPALGIFQMEPSTHEDIWKRWLMNYPGMLTKFMRFCLIPVNKPPAELMIYHSAYACGMARILYSRSRKDIPATLEGQAAYWKEHYNTSSGSGTVEEYIKAYERYTAKPKGK